MVVLYVALTLLVALILVLVVRTLSFRPPVEEKQPAAPVSVDAERATESFAELIRCKTVSDKDPTLEDPAEFEKFKSILPRLFPKVYEITTLEEPSDRSLLLKWEGKRHDAPTVLMSHYDVVSVEEQKWERPAFEGILEDGVLWGRGTLDTKGTLNAILFAAESLMNEGFVPEEDIYFAFGGDEEIGGYGARAIVELFARRGITPGLVLDEGGAVVEKIFPGVSAPSAMIGIAEKGMVNVEYSVSTVGGHASSPAPITPIGRLSRACTRIESHPFPFRITKPTAELFDTLGRHASFLYRMIFANLWLFSPVFNIWARKVGGETNALVRTTVAFTQMEGSKGMNVLPATARMISNLRLVGGDTVESAVKHLTRIVNDGQVSIRVIDGMDPSVISRTDCEAYDRVKSAVSDTWQEALVTPYLMVACSDSRHWGVISDRVYRFSAMALSKEERDSIHGNNERIPVSTIAKAVEFYLRLMRNS